MQNFLSATTLSTVVRIHQKVVSAVFMDGLCAMQPSTAPLDGS